MAQPASETATNLGMLRDEYTSVVAKAKIEPSQGLSPEAEGALVTALVLDAEWTREGAEELLHTVKNYGHFFLRNAAALAAALEIEDGLLGH
jgi:hypothetical protein